MDFDPDDRVLAIDTRYDFVKNYSVIFICLTLFS